MKDRQTDSKFSFLTSGSSSTNQGLRDYMISVYNHMFMALAFSAFVALLAAKTGLALRMFSSPFGIIVSLLPLFVSIYLGAKFSSMSVSQARQGLLLYSGTMGLSLSVILLVFSAADVAIAFFSTSAMFAGMSIYGYTTKKDLSSLSSILVMAIWGILVASLLNMFFKSGAMSLWISFIAVVVFSVMVAVDTQRLRSVYYLMEESFGHGSEAVSKIAVFGAMQLYINFVAIFIHMLNLLRGSSSRD